MVQDFEENDLGIVLLNMTGSRGTVIDGVFDIIAYTAPLPVFDDNGVPYILPKKTEISEVIGHSNFAIQRANGLYSILIPGERLDDHELAKISDFGKYGHVKESLPTVLNESKYKIFPTIEGSRSTMLFSGKHVAVIPYRR